jgi:hypothetical protein
MARNIDVTLELDNRQYNRAISQSQRSTSNFVTSSTSGAGRIAAAFAAIGTASIIRSIAQVGGSFQQLQNSLNVVFGSVEAGADAFDRVQQFAAGTQFSVQQLTQAFIQLKGAGVEPTEELLQTFADTASITTDQMGTFQAALDLVSRSTAGGLGLEDLNRLADRGVPVFRILQERLGLTRLEVSKFGQSAEGANRIIQELLAGLQQDFGGALESQVRTLNYQLSQFGDALDKLKNALFETFGDQATDAITALTGAINRLADNTEALSRFAKMLVGVGIALGSLGALRAITMLMNGFQTGLISLIGIIVGGGGIITAFKRLGSNIGGLLGMSGKIRDAFAGRGLLATGMAVIGQIAFSVAGKFAGLLRILLRFAGPAGVLYAIYEGFLLLKSIFFDTSEEADSLTEGIDGMTGAMKRNEEAQKAFEERVKAAQEAAAEAQRKFNEEFGETIKRAKEFAKVDYRTELEQLEGRLQTAKDTLFQLRMAFVAANGDIENYSQLVEATKNEIKSAQEALQKYNDRLNEGSDELQGYDKFLVDLLEDTKAFSDEQEYAKQALEFLSGALAQGAMTTAEMEYAVDRLNDILGISTDATDAQKDAFDGFNDIVKDIAKNTENYNLLMERLIALRTEDLLTAEQYEEALKNLNQAFSENEGLNNFLDTLGQAQVALSEDLANAFLEGKSAMDSFKNFFKKLITQIIADILRLQIIQPILSAFLNPFGFGFGAGGSVIKLPGKAMGGAVQKGSPYIVGERGPELFVPRDGGSIVPNNMLGGQQVTYNINAVDAASFKAMVAKDPEFLFNVTQMGARRVPS